MTPNAAASAAAEVQILLRFLSQDARIPLSTALSKINDLRKAKLNTPEVISKTSLTSLSRIFPDDEKIAKQIFAAAKRASNPKSKKRSASGDGDGERAVASKRAKAPNGYSQPQSPAELEASLALPTSTLSVSELATITLQTNRAPLFLAFAVTLLKYTMPEQPLSSRLSLAQAVVGANSRTKAKSIGLVEGKSAEDEGWGEGQPRVRVMGRMVPVMRRHGYFLDDGGGEDGHSIKKEEEEEEEEAAAAEDSQVTIQQEENEESKELPLWGLDLEALKTLNSHTHTHSSPPTPAPSNRDRDRNHPSSAHANHGSSLPIHTPQSARAYLLKSFTQHPNPTASPPPAHRKNPPPRPTASQTSAASLSHLLRTLDLLFSSWTPGAGTNNNNNNNNNSTTRQERDELDRKAWDFYVRVRPDVEPGVGGWGQKGRVALGGILELRKMD